MTPLGNLIEIHKKSIVGKGLGNPKGIHMGAFGNPRDFVKKLWEIHRNLRGPLRNSRGHLEEISRNFGAIDNPLGGS